jgi:hypothetical protein
MVVISEIAALTPANIRLVSLKENLAPPVAAKGAEEITLEGLVIGDRQNFENALAGYVLLLETSPIFRQVTIQKNTVGPFMKGQALHFILNMKVEDQVRG